jgi:hypothetical protein
MSWSRKKLYRCKANNRTLNFWLTKRTLLCRKWSIICKIFSKTWLSLKINSYWSISYSKKRNRLKQKQTLRLKIKKQILKSNKWLWKLMVWMTKLLKPRKRTKNFSRWSKHKGHWSIICKRQLWTKMWKWFTIKSLQESTRSYKQTLIHSFKIFRTVIIHWERITTSLHMNLSFKTQNLNNYALRNQFRSNLMNNRLRYTKTKSL